MVRFHLAPPMFYSLAEWIKMEPGSIIPGLCPENYLWVPSKSWQAVLPKQLIAVASPAEKHVEWRKLAPRKKVKKVNLLMPDEWQLKEDKYFGLFHKTEIVIFNPELPVGIFLGNILRTNGRNLVNILTISGYDIWL